MELQLRKKAYDCLRRVAWEVKNEERTQEVRLPEAMPDIGKVLGAWGQALIRSKEWRGNSMGISGGIMAWVLYAPEDGSMPRAVDTWIPFQMRWDFPQTQRDGAMLGACQVGSVDARSISARKLMVRATVSVAGEALEPSQVDVYEADSLPEDIQLLRRQYPVRFPKESGEKTFLIDEELPVPPSCGALQKMIHYSLQPEILDKKVMSDKVVFRGTAQLHMLCQCEENQLKTCDFEIPFSQYAELEGVYDTYAGVRILPVLTNLELDIEENGMLRLKAGVVGQYVIYDRPVVEVIEDAYSPGRKVTVQHQMLQFPAVLDAQQERIHAEQALEQGNGELVEVTFAVEHPTLGYGGEQARLHIPGGFQMLYYDQEGMLQGSNVRWEESLDVPTATGNQTQAWSQRVGKPQAELGNGASLHGEVQVDVMTSTTTEIPMVTALELGEAVVADAGRPSLILRKMGNDSLWTMAKHCGSTVEAIERINGLTEPPNPDRMLLIPIP